MIIFKKYSIYYIISVLAIGISQVFGNVNIPAGARLKTLAQTDGVYIGTSISPDAFATGPYGLVYPPDYLTYIKNDYNMVQPENGVLFANTEATQGVFTFSVGDSPIAWGNANGARVHCGHLIWYYQNSNPAWVINGTWTAQTLTTVMENHIQGVMSHWNASVSGSLNCKAWNVVNEAFSDTATSTDWTQCLRGNSDIWCKIIGYTYIQKAFIKARSVDPNTMLIYNDYNVEQVNAKSNAMYNMVSTFKQTGIPIDAVGLQSHWLLNTSYQPTIPDYNSWAANLDRFSKLGVYIYVTEFDQAQRNGTHGDVPSAANDDQARVYYNILDKAFRCPMFKGFQTWGYTDAISWIRTLYPGINPTGLPFDDNWIGGTEWPTNNPNFKAKPAYYAIQDALTNEIRSELTTNGGFESGANPWFADNCTLAAVTTAGVSHSGTGCLLVSNRGANWAGPGIDVTNALLTQGSGHYYLSQWMKFASGTGTGSLVLQITDAAGTHWCTTNNSSVGTNWTNVAGWTNVTWFKNLINATLYVESSNTTNFYIDDVRIGDGNVLSNGAFENGIVGWTGLGGASIVATGSTNSAGYHYGTGGLSCFNRTSTSQVVGQNILNGLLASGMGKYNLQAYMKLAAGSGSGTGKVTIQLTANGGQVSYISVSGPISDAQWTKVSGIANVTWIGQLTGAVLYVETPPNATNYYVDDVTMTSTVQTW